MSDFEFSDPWPDPKGMVERLNEKNIRLVLWQIPVLKYYERLENQHEEDVKYALKNDYAVKKLTEHLTKFLMEDGLKKVTSLISSIRKLQSGGVRSANTWLKNWELQASRLMVENTYGEEILSHEYQNLKLVN